MGREAKHFQFRYFAGVRKFITIVFLVSATLSCSGKKEENLQLELISDDLVMIDVTGCKCGSDCSTSADLSSQIIRSNTFNLKWKGDRYLEIQSIRVELKGGDLSEDYKYVFTEDELIAMFGTAILTFEPSANGQGTDNTSFENFCAFKVGGIPIDEDKSGSLSGKIIFKGFTAKNVSGLDPENFRYEREVNVTYSP